MNSKRRIAGIFMAAVLVSNSFLFANLTKVKATPERSTFSSRSLMGEKEKIDREIEILDSNIEKAMSDVDKNKKELQKIKEDIEKTTIDANKTVKEIKEADELYRTRARAMYISGMDGYLEVLLDSKGLSDFISRLDSVIRIISNDKKVVQNLMEEKENLNTKKQKLVEESFRIEKIKNENEKKLSDIKLAKEKQMTLLGSLNQSEGIRTVSLGSIDNNIVNSRPSRGGDYSSSSSNIVSSARKFLGVPYVWGGTSPSGFDCSGFVQYVYSNCGMQIGRTTYEQINAGKSISRGELQPGDLVFFGTSSNPHHVGIYVGNNSYIHAPRTGEVVKVAPMTRGDFLVGKRVK